MDKCGFFSASSNEESLCVTSRGVRYGEMPSNCISYTVGAGEFFYCARTIVEANASDSTQIADLTLEIKILIEL